MSGDEMSIGNAPQVGYEVLETNNFGGTREEIIKTSEGTIWGVKYSSTDKNPRNFEKVSVYTLSEKNGKLIRNQDAKDVQNVKDLTKEYLVLGEEISIVKQEHVVNTSLDGYSDKIVDKGLANFLIGKLIGNKDNNTKIDIVDNGFISGENNSNYMVRSEENTFMNMKKPPIFEPEPELKNKIEQVPENIKEHIENSRHRTFIQRIMNSSAEMSNIFDNTQQSDENGETQ